MGFSRHKFTTTYTQELSQFIVNADEATYSQEAKDWAQEKIESYLSAIQNKKEWKAQAFLQNTRREICPGQNEQATLWSDGSKSSAECAAMVNGMMLAEAIGSENVTLADLAAAATLPVAQAIGEAKGAGKEEQLLAFMLGCEVYLRVARAIKTTHEISSTWNKSHSACQLFAGIAAGAKLEGLDALKTNQLLGMGTAVCTLPSGMELSEASDAYFYECGFRNSDAVQLVRCARLGVLNLEDALDDTYAFASHFHETPQLEALGKDLGDGGKTLMELAANL